MKRGIVVFGIIISFLISWDVQAAMESDAFIKGYASAILEREHNIKALSISVDDGIIYITVDRTNDINRQEIIDALSGIEGVRRIEIQTNEGKKIASPLSSDEPEEISAGSDDTIHDVKGRLFDPLLADPRWPTFSGAYQYYMDDELTNVLAASVGDVIPFYTSDVPLAFGGMWQAGVEAGAFVIHDYDTTSWDQINADYLFGAIFAYRKDTLSGLFRVFHLSSHIGDEYLLHNDVDRENFSYEALGLTLSKDYNEWLRVYAGGEYRFSRSPKDLKPFAVQYGFEVESPVAYLQGILRPVAAADFQHKEDNDWSGEVSIQAGTLVENSLLIKHRLRFMLGYFNGHSPNGQFNKKSVEYISFGMYYNL